MKLLELLELNDFLNISKIECMQISHEKSKKKRLDSLILFTVIKTRRIRKVLGTDIFPNLIIDLKLSSDISVVM
jgi:hypothetical protein